VVLFGLMGMIWPRIGGIAVLLFGTLGAGLTGNADVRVWMAAGFAGGLLLCSGGENVRGTDDAEAGQGDHAGWRGSFDDCRSYPDQAYGTEKYCGHVAGPESASSPGAAGSIYDHQEGNSQKIVSEAFHASSYSRIFFVQS